MELLHNESTESIFQDIHCWYHPISSRFKFIQRHLRELKLSLVGRHKTQLRKSEVITSGCMNSWWTHRREKEKSWNNWWWWLFYITIIKSWLWGEWHETSICDLKQSKLASRISLPPPTQRQPTPSNSFSNPLRLQSINIFLQYEAKKFLVHSLFCFRIDAN